MSHLSSYYRTPPPHTDPTSPFLPLLSFDLRALSFRLRVPSGIVSDDVEAAGHMEPTDARQHRHAAMLQLLGAQLQDLLADVVGDTTGEGDRRRADWARSERLSLGRPVDTVD